MSNINAAVVRGVSRKRVEATVDNDGVSKKAGGSSLSLGVGRIV